MTDETQLQLLNDELDKYSEIVGEHLFEDLDDDKYCECYYRYLRDKYIDVALTPSDWLFDLLSQINYNYGDDWVDDFLNAVVEAGKAPMLLKDMKRIEQEYLN